MSNPEVSPSIQQELEKHAKWLCDYHRRSMFDDVCGYCISAFEKLEAAYALGVQAQQIGNEWLPTALAINALPEPLRKYIHDLETRCDPAGDTRELTIARDTIRSLESLVGVQAPRAQEWQPIETAPKDGSEVLLYCEPAWDVRGGHCAVGSWHDSYGGSWWDRGMEYTLTAPKFWQPLPDVSALRSSPLSEKGEKA